MCLEEKTSHKSNSFICTNTNINVNAYQFGKCHTLTTLTEEIVLLHLYW